MTTSYTQTAKLRASFARAERMKRKNMEQSSVELMFHIEEYRTNKHSSHILLPLKSQNRNLKQKRDELNASKKLDCKSRTEIRKIKSAIGRYEHINACQKIKRHQELSQRVNKEHARIRIRATQKRVEDNRRKHALQIVDQKRDEMRRAFNREAERRRDVARRLVHERTHIRAAAEIEHRHKRQAADQQVEHRRQTSEIRVRHQAETRSLRSNESMALERHHHAVKRLDEAEGRALSDFDARRTSLTGRLAERIPGRRAENDRRRAEISRGFEAERMTKHRDLEALKERQFAVAQKARLNQAKERKAIFDTHRTDRLRLQDRQLQERPRLIEQAGRSRALPEREHSRKEPSFERPLPERK